MICKIRKWLLSDAEDLAVAISNKKVQDNLRDGIPYPYTVQDGINFISAMLSADENDTLVAVMPDGKAGMPCGACREFMMQLDKAAGEIEVLRDYETKQVAKLKTLIPDWWK